MSVPIVPYGTVASIGSATVGVDVSPEWPTITIVSELLVVSTSAPTLDDAEDAAWFSIRCAYDRDEIGDTPEARALAAAIGAAR